MELPRPFDSKSLTTDEQDGTTLVAVDTNLVKPSEAFELSSGQLLIGCAVIFLLMVTLFWFLYDVGEWLPRLGRRLRRLGGRSGGWDNDSKTLYQYPMVESKLAPLVLEESADILRGHSEPVANEERVELLESEPVETVESNDANRQKELHDGLSAPPPCFDDLTATLESQSVEVGALEQEVDGEGNEVEALTNTLGEVQEVALVDAEARYEKLADELAESQLAQSHLQTDLANSNQSLESMAARNTQVNQEMESACQELRDKGDLIVQLESKLASSESRLESLEEKLGLAQAELENQVEQTLVAETRITEVQNQTFQLRQQLEEQRDGDVESLTAKLAERTNALEKLGDRLNEAVASADQKAASLEESEVRYQTQVKEEANRYEQAKQELELELESAKQHVAELQQYAKSSELELAQNATKHAEELSDFKSNLEETQKEKQSQLDENEKLKSALQQVEDQLSIVEADAKQALESKKTIQAELKEEAGRYEQSKRELESELESVKQEHAMLRQHAESFEAEVAQNATKHAEELGELRSSLEEAKKEKQTQRDENEKLNSVVAEAESDLTSARAEMEELKSKLSASTASAEQIFALEEKLEEASSRTDVSLMQIDSLTSKIGELENQLGLKTEELETAAASQLKRDEQWDALSAQSKLFQQRASEAELKLGEASKLLVARQASFVELEESAQQDKDELSLQVSKISELNASVKSLEVQMLEAQRKLVEAVSLLEQEKSTREEIENTVKQQAEELNILSTGKSNLESELKPLQIRAQEVERKLEEAVMLLEQEQTLHAEVEKTAQGARAELNAQQSRGRELEASVKSLECQLQDASKNLEQTTSELEKTRSLQIELEKTTEQQKTELGQKDTQYMELQTKLRATVESNYDKLTSESRKLKRQGRELEELRIVLKNEKVQRSGILEKLEASEIRVAELEQQAEASSVDKSEYDNLAQRAREYKTAYQKNIAFVESLTERKAKMSKLATEYLSVAKILRGKLDDQLAITANLRQRLDNANSIGTNPPNLKLLVQERARADVLALKAEFEERLKEKNQIIRKLKNKESIQS